MWYSVRLRFRSNDPDLTGQEDTIHLIDAESEQEARSKASALGVVERQYFQSPDESRQFEFVGVSDIRELNTDEPYDGMEVWSIHPH